MMASMLVTAASLPDVSPVINESEIVGAQVDEVGLKTIRVVGDSGGGDPSGGEEPIFPTIRGAFEAAAASLKSGQGVRIVIEPGTYRETGIKLDGQALGDAGRDATLLIEGAAPYGVVWTGAEPVEDWKTEDAERAIFSTRFDGIARDSGQDDEAARKWIPGRLGRQNVLVFDRGGLVRQVLGETDFEPMTFRLEHDSDSSGRILVRLRAGETPTPGRLEIAGRGGSVPLLEIAGKNNLIVRKISFRGCAATPWLTQAVRFNNCSNVLLEDLEFRDHNTTGLGVGGIDNLTIRRISATDNGASGMHGVSGRNQVIEDSDFSRNGWRSTGFGGQAMWYDAGIKHGFGLRDAIFRRITCHANDCAGFWLDSDMEDIVMDGLSLKQNGRTGMWWEASRGPGVLRNSEIEGNRENGLLVGDAGGLQILDNRIFGNEPTQVVIAISTDASNGEPGRMVTDRVNGLSYQSGAENISMYGNRVMATAVDQRLVSFAWGNLPGRESFLRTFRAGENVYWHPAAKAAFSGPIVRFRGAMDFESWRQLLRTLGDEDAESGSTWQPPDR